MNCNYFYNAIRGLIFLNNRPVQRATASSRLRRSTAFTQIAFTSTLRQLRQLATVARNFAPKTLEEI